jgi:dTDP-4-amino-4,6-dideoxygalactose transaminase
MAMEDINAIAAKHNLLVVEDAAQSHGAMAIKKTIIENQKSSVAYSFILEI